MRRRRLVRLAKGLLLLAGLVALAVIVLPAVIPFPEDCLASRERTIVLRDRSGEPIRFHRDADGRRYVPVRLERVSPRLVDAIVAVEDSRFRDHGGVDPLAAARAAWSNASTGRVVSGASTITMQLARLLDPCPRDLAGKAVQALRAVQIERRLGKDEILERYLDRVPLGRNLRGVEAACRLYFGKPADRITLGEATLLAGMIQSPTRLDPIRNPAAARVRRRHVLDRMLEEGLVTAEEHRRETAREPVARFHPFPFVAPHFAEIARGRATDLDATTTLDRDLQVRCEAALRERLDALGDVDAGAIVVLRNETASVETLVGGPGWERPRVGRIDLSRRRRSPGSALKPFLYALALERGDIRPETLLADVPGGISGYEPGNFDRGHRGLVTAREALRTSLNVPAIRLLSRAGPDRLIRLLDRLGVGSLRDAGDHGLALALGGGEVTLLDLTAAYAAVAAGGRWREPRFLADEPMSPGRPALPAGVCHRIAEMLAHRDGPRTDAGETLFAIKTGTSNGRRDAWAFGFDPDWTVGVWLGNGDGRPSPRLVGRTAAVPLLREVFRSLRTRGAPRWYPEPGRGLPVDVCAATGLRAGPLCPETRRHASIPGASSLRRCEAHREILVDRETGEWRCGRCAAGRPVRRQVALVHDPATRAFLERTGLPAGAPPHASDCARRAPAPRILLPSEGHTVPRALRLRADAEVDWFVDGSPVGRGASLTVTVAVGEHVVHAVGRAGAARTVRVQAR